MLSVFMSNGTGVHTFSDWPPPQADGLPMVTRMPNTYFCFKSKRARLLEVACELAAASLLIGTLSELFTKLTTPCTCTDANELYNSLIPMCKM